MTIQFKNRVAKARNTKVVKATVFDSKFELAAYKVNGSADLYNVLIYKPQQDILEEVELGYASYLTRCDKVTSSGHIPCQGNSHKSTVCYHVMTAFVEMAKERGKTIAFFETVLDALNYRNLGGSLIKIRNRNGGKVWAVVQDKKVLETAINLMRGDEEEGID